jgi:hypothetical protein
MADKNVPDLSGIHEWVIQRQDGAAGNPKDVGDPSCFKCAHQALGSGDLLAHDYVIPSKKKPSDPGG